MRYNEVLSRLQNLINYSPSQSEFCSILGIKQSTMSNRVNRDSEFSSDEIVMLNDHYGVNLFFNNKNSNDSVVIPYYPEVVFSAGYGVEIYDDGAKEYITLDERLFRTDRGTKINPKYCELLTISGNSMYPKWEDGDRFILDKSVTSFIDGQTFAFKLNGECYIKEICLLGKRAKAIPLNKNYDEFYIEPEDELQIFGRVVPKVRL